MTAQEKIDLFKSNKEEYASPKKPILVKVKKAAYLAVDGCGGPDSDDFQIAIGALYGMAYTVKMTRKFSGRRDYVVCKLETLYWSDGGAEGVGFNELPPENRRWKLMIRTPDFVIEKELKEARAALMAKGKGEAVDQVRLESLTEGRCVQMLHVGPYDQEGETLAVMRAFAEEKGRVFHGLHHDIYLSDPRRVPPDRLKTILRRPVKPA
jgi:hypothetical protein